MSFRIGDKVKIREDLIPYESYGNVRLMTGSMQKIRGRIFKIRGYSGNHYNIYDNMSKNSWVISEEMIEPIDTEKLVIYRNGYRTIAKYYKNDKTATAEINCCSCDSYDFKTGAELAMGKVFEKMKEEERVYTKIKCVWSQYHDSPCGVGHFTVGSIYEISNDGHILTDAGVDWQQYAKCYKTKEDILSALSSWYKFEEV